VDKVRASSVLMMLTCAYPVLDIADEEVAGSGRGSQGTVCAHPRHASPNKVGHHAGDPVLNIGRRTQLGKGSSGTVYAQFDGTSAVKRIDLSEENAWETVCEITVSAQENWDKEEREVLGVSTSYQFHGNSVLIGFQRLDETLSQWVRRNQNQITPQCTSSMLMSLLVDITTALVHIHAAGWVHGDLAPANIMLTQSNTWHDDQPRARIIDFGTTHLYTPSTLFCASANSTTVPYAAPERLGKTACKHLLSNMHLPASDVWSLGCIFSDLLLTGYVGFPSMSDVEDPVTRDVSNLFSDAHVSKQIAAVFKGATCPQSTRDLICNELLPFMWQPCPRMRPTAKNVLDYLLKRQRGQPVGDTLQRKNQLVRAPPVGQNEDSAVVTSASQTLAMCNLYSGAVVQERYALAALWSCLGESLPVETELARLLMPAYHIACVHDEIYKENRDHTSAEALFVAVFFAAVCVSFPSFVMSEESILSVARMIARVKLGHDIYKEFNGVTECGIGDYMLHSWAKQILTGRWSQHAWSITGEIPALQSARVPTRHLDLPVMACLRNALADSRWRTTSYEWREMPGAFDQSLAVFRSFLDMQPIRRASNQRHKRTGEAVLLRASNPFDALAGGGGSVDEVQVTDNQPKRFKS
jgi:serine/threonine protein kinase